VQTSLSTGLWVTWRDSDVGVGVDIVIDAFTGDVVVVGMDVVNTGLRASCVVVGADIVVDAFVG